MSSFENFRIWFESLGSSWGLAAQIFIIVLVTLLLDFAAKKVLDRLYEKLQLTPTPWDDSLVDALRSPVSALIWILGIALAIDVVRHETHVAIFEIVQPLRNVSVIFCIAWFLIRFIKRAEDNIGEKHDKASVAAISKLIRVSINISATLVALETLGFSISGVLAFGGVGGIAIGFAAKDLLANFFGGLMFHLDRPFS
ncbi:MAG: mechanosensitive ion channel protein MscS, partial [Deltaproteobacteria bacterium 21-66-5]